MRKLEEKNKQAMRIIKKGIQTCQIGTVKCENELKKGSNGNFYKLTIIKSLER